jgi:hypothetical protein
MQSANDKARPTTTQRKTFFHFTSLFIDIEINALIIHIYIFNYFLGSGVNIYDSVRGGISLERETIDVCILRV